MAKIPKQNLLNMQAGLARPKGKPAEELGPVPARPEFTAVVTSYFEEKTLEEFYTRLTRALNQVGRSYEIIMVNDGSTDRTFEIMKTIYARDPNVFAIIDFCKNAGQLAAMTAGVCWARGRRIVFLDSDLQLSPEELPRLVEESDKGYDLVTGYREHRQDSLTRILPSKLANVIMRRASQSNLRDFGCTFKIWNAEVLRAFEYGPFRLFNTASAISKISRYKEVPVSHRARAHGKSGWTFRKLWQFNMDNLVNMSRKPFQIIALLCGTISVLFVFRVIFDAVFPFKILREVSNGLLLNVLAISALLIIAILCIMGEFIIRNYDTAQREPKYIIREMHRRNQE